jgi:ribonuclease HI
MQKVSIYIDAYHTGHLKRGTGSYTIVMEYVKDNYGEVTREYIEGVKDTTKNRPALHACISALLRMKRPCEITVTINSQYVVQAINTGDIQKWITTGKKRQRREIEQP